MHKVMSELHKDHVHLSKLLQILQQQVGLLSTGEAADMLLMIDIADYIHHYSDQYHHPKEDKVYLAFQASSSEAANIVAELMADHRKMPGITLDFQHRLDNVINTDMPVNRQELCATIQDFIDLQHTHMNLEEKYLFPLIESTLGEDSWQVLESTITESVDPLFGDQVVDSYQELSRQVQALAA